MAKTKAKNTKTKEDIWYKVLTVFIALCLLAGLIVTIFVPTGLAEYISLHSKTAVKSDNFSVNAASMTFLTHNTYNNMNYTKQYYEQYGLNYGEVTFEGARSNALVSLKQTLALCEAAKAEGKYELDNLDNEDKEYLDSVYSNLKEEAKSRNYSLDDYKAYALGSKTISESDIKQVVEYQLIAKYYEEYLRSGYTFDDAQITEYFNEHKNDYLKADYYEYEVKATYPTDATEEQKTEADNAAKAKADELVAKIEAGEDFVKVVYEYEKELAQATFDTAKEEAEKLEDAEAKETALKEAQDTFDAVTEDSIKTTVTKTAQQYSSSTDDAKTLNDWIFAETPAADGTVKVINNTKIYQITKAAYKDEYNYASYRTLTLKLSQFTDAEEMNAKAQEIVDAFNKSDKTGEAFDNLAEQFTEKDEEGNDKITVTSSGLLEDKTKTGVENADAWLFSDERKAGDVTVIIPESGTNKDNAVIYLYEKTGETVWKKLVKDDLTDEKYEEDRKVLEEKYPITINEEVINDIK